MIGQLPLGLGHRVAQSAEDFLVAPCNAEAHAWLERWPDWPATALTVFGPEGSGKSHLARLFADRAGAAVMKLAELAVDDPPRLLEQAPAVVLEDADGAPFDQVALFHLYNLAKEGGAHLLLTARQPPSRWELSLADLRSRLNSCPSVAIGAPDDQLLAALLVKLFADRQLRVPAEVVDYLQGRMERSFAAASAVVAALDAASLADRRPLTVPLARRVLEGLAESDERQGELDV
jgi:DnaA regulatory inactivator Hda